MDTNNNSRWCSTCNVPFTGLENAAQHYNGQKHRKMVGRAAATGNQSDISASSGIRAAPNPTTECAVCNVPLTGPESAAAHYAGKKHEKQLERLRVMGMTKFGGASNGVAGQGNIEEMLRNGVGVASNQTATTDTETVKNILDKRFFHHGVNDAFYIPASGSSKKPTDDVASTDRASSKGDERKKNYWLPAWICEETGLPERCMDALEKSSIRHKPPSSSEVAENILSDGEVNDLMREISLDVVEKSGRSGEVLRIRRRAVLDAAASLDLSPFHSGLLRQPVERNCATADRASKNGEAQQHGIKEPPGKNYGKWLSRNNSKKAESVSASHANADVNAGASGSQADAWAELGLDEEMIREQMLLYQLLSKKREGADSDSD